MFTTPFRKIINKLRAVVWLLIISPILYILKDNIQLLKKSRISFPNLIAWDVIIWDYSYMSHNCQWNFRNWNKLRIWKFCSIASWVEFICGTDHDYKKLTTFPTVLLQIDHIKTETIEIWNDVWIWRNAIILKWRKIWTWAVIWAWSVVTKDIPPYAIAVWNPAKVIKYRFDEKTIEKLLKSERWNRDIEKIKSNYNLEFINNI